jgi:hypothetical protein
VVALPSSRAQASPRVTAVFAPVAVPGFRRWPLGCGGAQRAADPEPRDRGPLSGGVRRQPWPTAHQPRTTEMVRKREPGADPGLSACPVPASLPYQDPLQRKGSARRAIRGIGSDNPKMISARPCRLWRALIGALTSTGGLRMDHRYQTHPPAHQPRPDPRSPRTPL